MRKFAAFRNINQILKSKIDQDNIGDKLSEIIVLRKVVTAKFLSARLETKLEGLRESINYHTHVGGKIYTKFPDTLENLQLKDSHILQIASIVSELKSLCYGFESVERWSMLTYENSVPVRFYLNSLYHFISSMFLVDTSKDSHKGLSMGGTMIKALQPMELGDLLDPIQKTLNSEFGGKSIGNTILLLRHSMLVHGDHSPENIKYLLSATGWSDKSKQMEASKLLWDLYYDVLLLQLQLLAILTMNQQRLQVAAKNYFEVT